MAASGPERDKGVYIFKRMTPEEGYTILSKSRRAARGIPWLLRESSVDGMLTIDYFAPNNENKWKGGSTRFALTEEGWVKANEIDQKLLASKISVSKETASRYIDSLESLITELGLKVADRVNPKIEQRTQATIYSAYQMLDDIDEAALPSSSASAASSSTSSVAGPSSHSVVVKLPPSLLATITCPLSKKTFKDPVVLLNDRTFRTKSGRQIHLEAGRTYEKAMLKKIGIPSTESYENFTLKRAIDSLGSNRLDKLEALEAERLEDPISLEALEEAMIIPSGHSFSRETIDTMIVPPKKCPITRKAFTDEQVRPNQNLNEFIREWKTHKDEVIAQHKGPRSSSASRL